MLGRVSGWAREIVAKRLLIVAAVAGVAHLVVGTGLVPPGISEQAELWTVSTIDAIALVGAIFWARSGTTPADPALQPRSIAGRPLVEDVPHDGRAAGRGTTFPGGGGNVHVRRRSDPPPSPPPAPRPTGHNPVG